MMVALIEARAALRSCICKKRTRCEAREALDNLF